MTIGERIKLERVKKGLSQAALGQILNVTQQAVGKWEKDLAEPDHSALKTMASLFGTSIDYLLGNSIPETSSVFKHPNISPISTHRIPMLGKVACGEPIYADEDRESYVMAGTDINADFCLTAQGDSMVGARILDGDIVFCRQQDIVENGEIAAVLIGDEATLKRVYYYPENKMLVLRAENPKYKEFVYKNEELDEIRILGKAIAFQSDVR